MIEIDNENLEIKISETLSWKFFVKGIFEEIIDSIIANLEIGVCPNDEKLDHLSNHIEDIASLPNKITKDQILRLFDNIIYEYETNSNYDIEISIFDRNMIEQVVEDFIFEELIPEIIN